MSSSDFPSSSKTSAQESVVISHRSCKVFHELAKDGHLRFAAESKSTIRVGDATLPLKDKTASKNSMLDSNAGYYGNLKRYSLDV